MKKINKILAALLALTMLIPFNAFAEPEIEEHKYSDPTWEWSDNYTSAKAIFKCETHPDEDPEEIEAKISIAVKDATCTEQGGVEYKATVEFNSIEYSSEPQFRPIGSALGHTPNQEVEETKVEPTCTEKGYTTHTCLICGEKYNDTEVAALGHDIVHHNAQEATCTEVGWEAYDTCTRCDYTTYSEINALGHTPNQEVEETKVEPTCTEKGYTTHTCLRCGEKYNDTEVAALGHDLINHEAKEANCTEMGWNAYDTCTRCDYTTYSEIGALGHTPNQEVEETKVEPTCTDKGYSTHTCLRCAEKYNDTEVAALGHDWGKWKRTKAPTCTKEGQEKRVCKRDAKHIETRAISKTEHSLKKVAKKAPTTSKEGNKQYYECTVCGKKFWDSKGTKEVKKQSSIVIPKIVLSEADKKLPTESSTESLIKKTNTDKKDVKGSEFATLKLKATGKKKAVALSWKKVKNADGYIIYGSPCGKNNKMKKLKIIKSAKTVKYTVKKLEKAKFYKYIVVAYKTTADGKNRILTKSKVVHCVTNGGTHGNAQSIVLKASKLTIKKGKTAKISGTVKNNKPSQKHIAVARFESSDTKIATVDEKGNVKGIKKGTATIYVVAQNGVYKTVKVTIK